MDRSYASKSEVQPGAGGPDSRDPSRPIAVPEVAPDHLPDSSPDPPGSPSDLQTRPIVRNRTVRNLRSRPRNSCQLLYFSKRIVTANKLNNTEITIIIKNTKLWHASPKMRSEKSKEIQSTIKKTIPAEAPKAPELRDFFISWLFIIIVTQQN